MSSFAESDGGLEGSLVLPCGLVLATRSFGARDAPLRILAAHGWMDAASSFHLLGPYLAARGAYFISIDLPGHGRSAWLPASGSYTTSDFALALAEAWAVLAWSDGVLVGHSMGAGAASVAACALRGLRALVLLEGLGPVPRPSSEAATLFSRAVAARAEARRGAARAVYASIEAAAAHRAATPRSHPGRQYLSLAAARQLVERALEPAGEADLAAAAGEADLAAAAAAAKSAGSAAAGSSGWCFRHDPRIKGPSPHYYSEEQAHAFLAALACPVLLVLAVDGWPRPPDLAEARARCVRDLEVVTLPGSHHLHADPDTAPAVCAAVAAFLEKRGIS